MSVENPVSQLYFGDANLMDYWDAPHPTDLLNPAIAITPNPDKPNACTIQITLNNHGELEVPDAVVRLYWADPSTSCLPTPCCLLKEYLPVRVPPQTDRYGVGTPVVLGPIVSFTPSKCILGTNQGSLAFLAQVYSTALGLGPSVPTPNDPLSAVHNIQLVPPSPPTAAVRSLSLVTGDVHPQAIHFAFAATNPTHRTLRTEVIATYLENPSEYPDLCAALASPRFQRLSCCGSGTFRKPDLVHLHLGVERVLARYIETNGKGTDAFQIHGSRLGHTGPLSAAAFERLVFNSREETPSNFELRPFESRQVILGVVPQGKAGDVHAVQIVHRTKTQGCEKSEELGSLKIVYVVGKGFNS